MTENSISTDVIADEELATAPPTAQMKVTTKSPAFSDFDIQPGIVAALNEIGIVNTFAIQELTLPIALSGNDLIGQARTGTGKTLGFGVPLLNRITLPGGAAAAPQALVIAPTRELAAQVSGDLAAAGKNIGARVLTIYGGRAYEPQVEGLRKGVDVVVGTPGRLLDLAQQGHLVLGNVRILVLDEADEMLDLGFLPDIEKLMHLVPAERQTMLFSATMPGPIVTLARTFLNHPIQIRAEQGTGKPRTDHIQQFAYRAHAMDKIEVLARVLQARNRGLTLIFTRTKRTAAKVSDALAERGFAAGAVHGDLGQGAREQALRAFRSGKIGVLIATDVAARGLDVEGITHVVNYQAPEDEMTYVHRIGRTARAGATGKAITLVDWDDIPRWKLICDKLDLPLKDPVETYSTSPHLYAEQDIPTDATGTLPRTERTRSGLKSETIEDLGGRTPMGAAKASEHKSRPAPKRERSDRPSRPRNRTRAGQLVSVSATADAANPAAVAADLTNGEGDASARPRRRRRRHSGAGSTGASAARAAATNQPAAAPAAG